MMFFIINYKIEVETSNSLRLAYFPLDVNNIDKDISLYHNLKTKFFKYIFNWSSEQV